MRFLLVEDNADLARALIGRFALAGHVVDHAASLDAAETATRTVSYDLILLDINMPGMNAWRFLEKARKVLTADAFPFIVILSSSINEEDKDVYQHRRTDCYRNRR